MAARRPMLAKLHIARKELAMDEASYRAMLARVAGQESAAGLSDATLGAVLDEFRRLGWVPKLRRPRPSPKPAVRLIYALWTEMGPMLGSGGSREALRAFVRRQTTGEGSPDGVSAPEFLDPGQAIKVIEGLKAWKGRLRRLS